MRLPNGYGSVYKLSGKRRKPYIARKTIGWDNDEKQIYKNIGYFTTKTEALQALVDYNNDPYDLTMQNLTFEDAYNKWFEETFDETTNRSTIKNYKLAYRYCGSLYNMKLSGIKLYHLQNVVDNCDAGCQTAGRIKSLFNKIYQWAIRMEYVRKNYAENITLPKNEQKSFRRAFTREDINKIWEASKSNPNLNIILILLYCGVRINELLCLKKEDVNLEEQWFRVRASKTNAGIRIVPIADKVFPFWKEYMNKSKCEYAVCTPSGEQFTYDNFRKNYWHPAMDSLGMDYIPHETRHTCNSLLIMANVNPTIRKKIMGHKSQMDIGESVYGHIYNDELLKAINQI